METTLKKPSGFHLSQKTKDILVDVVAYIFIGLFIYTATDKLMDIERFIKFISKLDGMHSIGKYLAWMIPFGEIAISILLMIPVTRKRGLIASGVLMVIFTTYLIFMKIFSEGTPCHCGGVISRLTWIEHIYFNIIFVVLAGVAILFSLKKTK